MAVIFFGVGSVLFVSFSERFSSKDDVMLSVNSCILVLAQVHERTEFVLGNSRTMPYRSLPTPDTVPVDRRYEKKGLAKEPAKQNTLSSVDDSSRKHSIWIDRLAR